MDGVGTPIIGRPRPLPGHDTPNPTHHTYTLNYEEPYNFVRKHRAPKGALRRGEDEHLIEVEGKKSETTERQKVH